MTITALPTLRMPFGRFCSLVLSLTSRHLPIRLTSSRMYRQMFRQWSFFPTECLRTHRRMCRLLFTPTKSPP